MARRTEFCALNRINHVRRRQARGTGSSPSMMCTSAKSSSGIVAKLKALGNQTEGVVKSERSQPAVAGRIQETTTARSIL